MKTVNKYSWIIFIVVLYSWQDKMAYFIAESNSREEAIIRQTFFNDYSYEIKPESLKTYWGLEFKEVFLDHLIN